MDESSPGGESVLACEDQSGVGDRGSFGERGVIELGETWDVRAHPTACLLVPAGQLAQQLLGALLVALSATRTDPSHQAFGLVGLALDLPPERGPRGMAMLPCDRALSVGEPRFSGHASERLPKTADSVGVSGAHSPEEVFRSLTMMLHPLDSRQTVMDFARCLGHDGHLRSPVSAFGLQRASHTRFGTIVSRWEHPSPRTGGDLVRRGQGIAPASVATSADSAPR